MAAAQDLIIRLKNTGCYDPIVVIAADHEDEAELAQFAITSWRHPHQDFHFGRVLVSCLTEHQWDAVAYFGGSSAPLLQEQSLSTLAADLLTSDAPRAITNNIHSSDWLLTNALDALAVYQDRFPSDNPLGWVLSQEAGIPVVGQIPSASMRLDIDTPMDLALAAGHPAVGEHLALFLESLSPTVLQRVESIRELLKAQAKNLMIIGRASSHIWQALESSTQIWVRLLVEERGMVASQRLERGEVKSLAGMMVREQGPRGFIQTLADLSDGVIWDTRVWMAAEIGWPSAEDRFAADLGLVEHIQDETLRELTMAVWDGPIPIITGGYGVVSGGLYALLETIGLD